MQEKDIDKSSVVPVISIIIVNYRCWDKLRTCLESLFNHAPTAAKLEIIVVDNCSNDTQLETFKEQFPHVCFLLNQGNFGFANGCNTGAKVANGDYYFFVNPDTEMQTGVLDALLETMEDLPPYSVLATQKRNKNGKYERVERFFPRWYTLTGLGKWLHRTFKRKQIKRNFSKDKKVVFPEWVSGSVIFMRSTDFNMLNMWNEKFWMYSEDVDLCKRATERGGKVALLQNVAIIHNHGGSSRINPSTTALTKSEVYISRHVYLGEHKSTPSLVLIQPMLLIKSLLKTAFIAFISLLLFTHPKAKASRLLFYNLVHYYIDTIVNLSWLSPRSRCHRKVIKGTPNPEDKAASASDGK